MEKLSSEMAAVEDAAAAGEVVEVDPETAEAPGVVRRGQRELGRQMRGGEVVDGREGRG